MPQVDNHDHLEGLLYERDGRQYLKVGRIRRKGMGDWLPVKGEQWMPDDGGPSNGGQWLHPIPSHSDPQQLFTQVSFNAMNIHNAALIGVFSGVTFVVLLCRRGGSAVGEEPLLA